jgi:hypothetical protein
MNNPKYLKLILLLVTLVCGLSIMKMYGTEVKLSKMITMNHSLTTENDKLKAQIIELEKQLSELNAAGK